jgi:hypothetical protein
LIVARQFEGFQQVNSQIFYDFYFQAKELSFTKALIKGSFKTAGIWPINSSFSLEKLPRPVTPPILGGNEADSTSPASMTSVDRLAYAVEQAHENARLEDAKKAFSSFKELTLQLVAKGKADAIKINPMENQAKEANPSKKSRKRVRADTGPNTGSRSMNNQTAARHMGIDRSSPPEPAEEYEAPMLPIDSDTCDSSIVDVQSEPGSL